MPKEKKGAKVDLTLLKKMVGELESSLATADGIVDNKTEENVYDYVIEMSKCTGLAAGIMQEATMLMGDIQSAIRLNTSPAGKEEHPLASILGALKGGNGGLPGSN